MPRTYASLPVETRRRVVGRMVSLAIGRGVEIAGVRPWDEKNRRLKGSIERLMSYIAGEPAGGVKA